MLPLPQGTVDQIDIARSNGGSLSTVDVCHHGNLLGSWSTLQGQLVVRSRYQTDRPPVLWRVCAQQTKKASYSDNINWHVKQEPSIYMRLLKYSMSVFPSPKSSHTSFFLGGGRKTPTTIAWSRSKGSSVICSLGFNSISWSFFTSRAKTASGWAVESMQLACTACDTNSS